MKEGEGLLETTVHLPCPDKGCNGNIVGMGMKNGFMYFVCCVCGQEYKKSDGKYIKCKR